MELKEVKEIIKQAFPRRWFKFFGNDIDRLLEVVSVGVLEALNSSEKLYNEILVKTSTESLDEKERVFNIRSGEHLNIEDRRNRIIARQWERGGPTNNPDFEAALSLLSGTKVFIEAVYNTFDVYYKFQVADTEIDLSKPDLYEYIKRNKLGHLRHHLLAETKEETIALSGSEYNFSVEYPICGEFFTESIGGVADESNIGIESKEYSFIVQYPICGEFYAGEGEGIANSTITS